MKKNIIKDLIIITIFTIFAGILSVNYGVDRSADMRNYHIYNPWAFLNNRMSVDIMPADIQSYFNPLLDIPYFMMIKYLNNHPVFVTFLCGIFYAFYLYLIYKIAELVFKNYNKYLASIISVIVASGTHMLLSRLGWITHDMFISDLILISLYLIFKSFDKEYHPKLMFVSGLLLGCTVGFKYTSAIFVFPIFLTFLIFYKQFASPLKSFMYLCFGACAGVLVTDGFWMIKLYREFGNPLFPYFNWLFHSDYINVSNVYSMDYIYKSTNVKDLLVWPFYYHDDLRLKVLLCIFFINLFLIPFVKKENFKEIFNINITYVDFLLIFAFISYVIWLYTFAVPRYYSFIMGMVGVMSIVVILKLCYLLNCLLSFVQDKFKIHNKLSILKYNNLIMILIFTILLVSFFPRYSLPKTKRLLRVNIDKQLLNANDAQIPDNSIVFVQRGAGIIVPFQNPNAVYIGLNSERYTKAGVTLLSNKVINKIKYMMKQNPDKIYLLTNINLYRYIGRQYSPNSSQILYELDKLGLNTYTMECEGLDTMFVDKYNHMRMLYKLCKLEPK